MIRKKRKRVVTKSTTRPRLSDLPKDQLREIVKVTINKHPGVPGTLQPAPLRSHDVKEPKPEVQTVAGCSKCGKRRYFGKGVPANLILRLYCSGCHTHQSFNIVPREEWDEFAFEGGRERNVGRPKSSEAPEQGKQELLVQSGQDLGQGTDHPLSEGRPKSEETS